MSFKKLQTKGDQPSPRYQCSIATVGPLVFIFGGTSQSETNNETLVFNVETSTWQRIDVKGEVPTPRWGHSATSIGKTVFIFGGDSVGGKLNELWLFDTQSMTYSRPPKESGVGVQPRSCHSAVLAGKLLIIYGGEGDNLDQQLVALDTENMEWKVPEQKGNLPEPRKGHVAALHKNTMIVYGGWGTRVNQYLDDVWYLDLGTLAWTKANRKGPIPEPRGGACGTIFKNNFFVWGGWGAGPHQWNDLHYMDVGDATWLKRKPMGTVPSERFYHAAAVVKENQLILFGGQKEDKSYSNEVFILSTANVY